MQFEKKIVPQYREAGADGLIGLKGYMCYCQDVATWHMHSYDLGNDYLIDKLGIAWMYTKCRMKIFKKADFSSELLVETGMTGEKKVRVERDFRITGGSGELLALSRLESCLFNVNEKKLCKLTDIGFDFTEFDTPFEGLDYVRLRKDVSGMSKMYEYKIMYSDLDKSRHMNNLHYTDLFMNAFGPDFYEEREIREYDINYISQGIYGTVLSVYADHDGDTVHMVAVDETGKVTAAARMKF